jgi:hypothetical protein
MNLNLYLGALVTTIHVAIAKVVSLQALKFGCPSNLLQPYRCGVDEGDKAPACAVQAQWPTAHHLTVKQACRSTRPALPTFASAIYEFSHMISSASSSCKDPFLCNKQYHSVL